MPLLSVHEVNIDGLVGPTHHYAGLSAGNLASTHNALSTANPAAAALQGLKKMRLLHELGIKQAIMPPHQRPNLHLLHQLGFTGTPFEQINKAYRAAPELLSACYSASSMWAANAATVSASKDCADKRVHFTTANLVSNLHRHQEASFSAYLLKTLFHDERYFCHHPVLPASSVTGDEGAANHNRLCKTHDTTGINLFVYGKQALNAKASKAPMKYPVRQTLEASHAIARSHGLDPNRTLFACQNPAVIDQGVFHNDVIAVANESLLFIHEEALLNQQDVLKQLQQQAEFPLTIIEVNHADVSVSDAVNSYLFNSQLVTLPNGHMALIAPSECEHHPRVKPFLDMILADTHNPLSHIYYLDLKQSMRNGGGPACLRLRVPLNDDELQAMHPGIVINDSRLSSLEDWVKKHYRDRLDVTSLLDPLLLNESLRALDELSSLLHLGAIYPFQREQ